MGMIFFSYERISLIRQKGGINRAGLDECKKSRKVAE